MIPFPTVQGGYACVLSDPPWQYRDTLPGPKRGAASHYDTMPLEDIMALPVASVVADKAHLWLCTTNGFLEHAYALARRWGFEPVTVVTWVKTIRRTGWLEVPTLPDDHEDALDFSFDAPVPWLGMGRYLRNVTEPILFCERGKLGVLRSDVANVLFAPRTRHSEKPSALYEMVRSVSPGPRLEMFARRALPGFDAWGNQAPEYATSHADHDTPPAIAADGGGYVSLT